MIKIGRLYECDRCGESVFIRSSTTKAPERESSLPDGFEDMGGGDLNLGDGKSYPSRWEKLYGMDLCMDCARDFRKWKNYRAAKE